MRSYSRDPSEATDDMPQELKSIPTLSYDLITWLDENIALPRHLQPGEDERSNVAAGGARALIDELVAFIYQEQNPESVLPEDATSVLEIGSDGQLPSVLGGGRILGPGNPSVQVVIGETG